MVKKQVVRLSKKDLKSIVRFVIVLGVIFLVSYGIYSLLKFNSDKKWEAAFNEMNGYCNSTWQDYINGEVVNLMTEYNATNCKCFYENQYTMEQLASICLCSCELYYLNGTLITDDFRPLFSAIK